jgi:hypothetical protein
LLCFAASSRSVDLEYALCDALAPWQHFAYNEQQHFFQVRDRCLSAAPRTLAVASCRPGDPPQIFMRHPDIPYQYCGPPLAYL